MKKRISILVAVMMILSMLALASCGSSSQKPADYSDSKYVGVWKCSGLSLGDEKGELEDEWLLTVNKDGTGTLASANDSSSFNWSPANGGFKTTGDVKTTFKDAGDNIETKIIGVTLSFEKQE